jgi:hypothetical protein
MLVTTATGDIVDVRAAVAEADYERTTAHSECVSMSSRRWAVTRSTTCCPAEVSWSTTPGGSPADPAAGKPGGVQPVDHCAADGLTLAVSRDVLAGGLAPRPVMW